MRSRGGESDVEPPARNTSGRHLIDADARPAGPVLAEFHEHVPRRPAAVVPDLNLQRQQHAGGRHATDHLQSLDREVARWRRVSGTVDEPQRDAIRSELPERGRRLSAAEPVAAAKVTHHPEHPRLRGATGGLAGEFPSHGRDRLTRTGGSRRLRRVAERIPHRLHGGRRDRLPRERQPEAAPVAGRHRELR